MGSRGREDFDELWANIYSTIQRGFSEAVKALALNFALEITDCRPCSRFLVQMAKKTCCAACFARWAYDISDMHTLRCLDCRVPLKILMNGDEIEIICELVSVKEKTPGPDEHHTDDRFNKDARELMKIIFGDRRFH